MLIEPRPSATIAAMKLQFSLATLLVCMTVLAVVCASAVIDPVYERTILRSHGGMNDVPSVQEVGHLPNPSEIAWRLAISVPLSMAITLAVLWLIRQLKSRREDGPPQSDRMQPLKWQFSIIDLLIATAIVAIGLGGMEISSLVTSFNRVAIATCSFAVMGAGLLMPFRKKKLGAILGAVLANGFTLLMHILDIRF
jgi:hypothetical protein